MGSSPANSGMLTVPMMAGMILSSAVIGRLVARANKYKEVQVVGLAVSVAAFGMLAWVMGSGRGYLFIEPPIFLLGAGLGLVMPNMTIVVQSALPVARRGVGTAMLTFFRSLGGLLGVTGSGAILAHQLHAHGIEAAASAGTGTVLDPAMREVYRHAIANIFGAGTAIVLVALVILLFMPDVRVEGASVPQPAQAE
jgi:MFS family permease